MNAPSHPVTEHASFKSIVGLAALLLFCACPASQGEGGSASDPPEAGAGANPADTPNLADPADPNGAGANVEGLQEPGATPVPEEVPDFAPGGPIADAELGDFHIEMACAIDGEPAGTMTFTLWPQMPHTARNFLRYCAEDFYAGTSFYRIMRESLFQGGSPTGDVSGVGPYGMLEPEVTLQREFGHRYGVIGMARGEEVNSASCQFYVVCAETPRVWELDGEYTAFGQLVHGVSTLEAIASIAVVRDPDGGEKSMPLHVVTVTGTRVRRGAAPLTEPLERPLPDLGGEPARVKVQMFVVTQQGRDPEPRTPEETSALVELAHERVLAGEDFATLAAEFSDGGDADGGSSDGEGGPAAPRLGTDTVVNTGVPTTESLRRHYEGMKEIGDYRRVIYEDVKTGKINTDQFRELANARRTAVLERIWPFIAKRRADYPKAVGDAMFSMQAGEVTLIPQDAATAPRGWYFLKRVE